MPLVGLLLHKYNDERPIDIPDLHSVSKVLRSRFITGEFLPYPIPLSIKQRSSLLQNLRIHLLLAQATCKRRRICMNLDVVFSILNSRTRSITVRIPYSFLFRGSARNLATRHRNFQSW